MTSVLRVTYGLLLGMATAGNLPAAPRVAFPEKNGGISVELDGRAVATYVPGDGRTHRPYFTDLKTPSGILVTRNHPPVKGIDPDDHSDMHPGLWMAFADIGGRDFWRNKGPRVVQHTLSRGIERFDVLNRYVDGEQTMCKETVTYSFVPRPSGYLLVWETTLEATTDGVWMGGVEEMGLGVRLATPITVKHGKGRITSSTGGADEQGTWGRQASWCDYAGSIDGKHVGVTLMVAPSNPHKAWFHSRDYGLMVANPFGERAGAPARFALEKGKPLSLRFGVLIHESGAPDAVDIAAEYKVFVGEDVSVFDGKTLDGWDGDPRLWSVRDGAIRGETTEAAPAKGNTFLIWRNGTVKDFELRLKFRLTGDNNSGIQYRSKHAAEGERNAWVVKGYQAEIHNEPDQVGFIYDEGGSRQRMCLVGERVVWEDGRKSVIGSLGEPEAIAKSYRPGEWNDYRIVARGNHIRHFINGVQRIDFTDNDPKLTLREGILALQIHTGKPMRVEFKDFCLTRF